MCRLGILFYCQVLFHCMNITHLYYPFTIEGYSDCSQVLNTPYANCRFLCEYKFSFFLDKYVGLGLLDHVISPCDPMDYIVHGGSPGPNIGMGSCSLLQQIFPTQESNQGLLHCRRILYQLSYQRTLNFIRNH